MRNSVSRSFSMKEARTALITGMRRFKIAPFDARDLLMPQVIPSCASICPPTPAMVKLTQSLAVGAS